MYSPPPVFTALSTNVRLSKAVKGTGADGDGISAGVISDALPAYARSTST